MENVLYHHLGKFIVLFQRLEGSVTNVVIQIVHGNDEFVKILIQKHEFSSLVKTTDVLFSRYADERSINNKEKSLFHKTIVKCSKLSELRNNLVHSQYFDLVENHKPIALIRENSKLRSSKGSRVEESEDLTSQVFENYFIQLNEGIDEIEQFRLKIIAWNYPCA